MESLLLRIFFLPITMIYTFFRKLYESSGHSQEEMKNLQQRYELTIRETQERTSNELKIQTELLQNSVRAMTEAISGLNSANFLIPPDRLNYREEPYSHENLFQGQTSSPLNPPSNMSANAYAIYPKSHIRDALESVPKYDGHNIPVWQFARACKRAKDSIPLIDEALFVRMLRNKLSHHAYLAIEDETHNTVTKFLESLKKTFGPDRSANYYRGQLSIAYKKQGEHILDYIGKIKDLKTAIVEADQVNLNRTLTQTETRLIEAYALEAFYEGLPSRYRIELRAEGYTNFADACAKAITIHKRLEKEESRYKNNRNPSEGNTNNGTQAPTRILQRDNHSRPTETAATANAFDGTRKICTYCKNFGHLFHECRKRQYHTNNPRFDNYNNVNNHNNNSNNSNNNSLTKTGNPYEASANGTNRGQGNVRPILPLECTPQECTSSDQTPSTYQSSSSNHLPFEVP